MAKRIVSLSHNFIIGILLLAWTTNANGQTADSKPKPTGSISGRVTISGKASAGIHVAAVSGQTAGRRDAAGRAVTNYDGNYQISGLEPGQYQVWAMTPGMIGASTTFPFHPYFGSVKNVVVAASEDLRDLEIKLIHGSVITGRITDTDDKPVVDERVSVLLLDANGSPQYGPLGSSVDQMYQTDDRGIYRIFGLPPGRYKVSVGIDANDGMRRGRRYPKIFYPDAADPSKATIIELKEADEAKNIDIKVQPPAPAYNVSGRVVDTETGLPIPSAGVRFAPVIKGSGQPAPGYGIQADDRGEFTFYGISPGQYSALATSDMYGGNFYGNPISFEIIDKDVAGLELKTVPGLSVSGVVVVEGMSTKELLARAPGLKIGARGISSPNNQYNSGGDSLIAPDGSFQVDGLRSGRVTIMVTSSGGGMVRPPISRIEHLGIGIGQSFDIQQSVSGLRVVLSFGTGSIRGAVRFQGDASIGDVQAYVTCRREGGQDFAATPVDNRGQFLIKNLGPGKYELTVAVRGHSQWQAYRPPPPQKQTVEVINGSETEVNFVIDLVPRQGGP